MLPVRILKSFHYGFRNGLFILLRCGFLTEKNMHLFGLSDQMDIFFCTCCFHIGWPNACLYFADMCFPQEKHAKS